MFYGQSWTGFTISQFVEVHWKIHKVVCWKTN